MVRVRQEYRLFAESGGEVVVVSPAEAEPTARFHQRMELPFDLLADPELKGYRAFGLGAGSWWQIAGPAVWWAGLKAVFRGGLGRPQGNLRQMPGTFVVDTQGTLRWAHRPRHQAQMPDHDQIRRVLRELSGG